MRATVAVRAADRSTQFTWTMTVDVGSATPIDIDDAGPGEPATLVEGNWLVEKTWRDTVSRGTDVVAFADLDNPRPFVGNVGDPGTVARVRQHVCPG